MTTSRGQAVRVGVGAAILLVGGGYATSRLIGDDADTSASASPGESAEHEGHEAGTDADPGAEGHDHGVGDHHGSHEVTGDGRTAAAGDYQLSALRLVNGRVSFGVLDQVGSPVDQYAMVHEKPLHMFVFGTDLSDFRHVHPTQRGDRWALPLDGLRPGPHRVIAEFTPQGGTASVMLGGTIKVPGKAYPQPLPPPATTTTVDGYQVSVDGELVLGRSSDLGVAFTDRAGKAVELEPYLGSWCHAVLIHADTLAVAHLHPHEEYTDGGDRPDRLTLTTPFAVAGEYRLIVEFATDTGVHQAEFMLPSP